MRRPPALGDNSIVASAADTRHSTGSSGGSGAKTSGENHPARPAQPGMNAVACEVHVIATGARPAEKGGQRELFTEETTTALVFENGGVLRLAAAVVPGQLLFLTHMETKREVVAQVTRKRDFRPTICYVEVEFSEPADGFWGIEFPKVPTPAPAHARQEAGNELAQEEQDILAGELAEPPTAPSAQEISALKDEVEVLREQLKLLQTQIVAGSSPAPATSLDPTNTTPPQPPRAAIDVAGATPVLAPAPAEQSFKSLNASGGAPQESTHGTFPFSGQRQRCSCTGTCFTANRPRRTFIQRRRSLAEARARFQTCEGSDKTDFGDQAESCCTWRVCSDAQGFAFCSVCAHHGGRGVVPESASMAVSSEEFPSQPSFKPHLAANCSRDSKTRQRRFRQVAADNRGSWNFSKRGFASCAATRIAGIRAGFHNRLRPKTPAATGRRRTRPQRRRVVAENRVVAASAGKRAVMSPLNKAAMVSAVPASDGAESCSPKLSSRSERLLRRRKLQILAEAARTT